MITKPKIQIDLKQVESLAANGLTQEQIACALGISESTLTKRKKEKTLVVLFALYNKVISLYNKLVND